jgi:ubiquinone/menaquinone biosynthesis C-methylase UbiE
VAERQTLAVDLHREGLDPKTANAVYHDAAASTYDRKWAISFDERARSYVRARAERMLPSSRYGRVLEVGCGTGYLLLNLWQCGYAAEPQGCDISPGMLEACGENARRLGCEISLRAGDAERLPYDDREFDLVVGHAFLHHLPQPAEAIREMFRVLRPGGAVFITGEPTRLGDRIAAVAKRAAWRGFELAARFRPDLRRPPAPGPATEEERIIRELEFAVDLHTFEPAEVEEWAGAAGFERVRTETEELTAAVFGWSMRTVEALVRPELRTERWGQFAYRSWLRLYRLDQEWLYRVVPKRAFYNVLLYAERPLTRAISESC